MNKKIRRIKKHNSIENRKYLKEMKIAESKFKFIKYRRNAFKKILTEMCVAMDHLHKCKPVPGKKYGTIQIAGYNEIGEEDE